MQFRKTLSLAALSVAVLGAASGAYAQGQAGQAGDPNAPGPYGSVSVGRSHSNINGDDVGGAFARQGVNGVTSVDKNGTGYGLGLGYRINRNFAVEGGYTDLGRFDYRSNPAAGGNVDGRLKANAFHVSAVGIAPFGNGWSAFGKLGVARTKTELSAASTGGAPAVNGASENGTHPLAGVGIGYDLSHNVTAKAEWNRFFKVGEAGSTGRGDVDLLSVGLNYRF
jgi:OOP family OmpA-OmpF porin